MENENDIEFRIEKLEFEKEEVEDEIQTIENTIQELKEITDKIPSKEINIKVSRFIRELENDKSNNEEMKEQLEHDIERIRGIEDD
jgi:predicted  nucleic acid-binding Zn-ribbon protein